MLIRGYPTRELPKQGNKDVVDGDAVVDDGERAEEALSICYIDICRMDFSH